MLAMTVAIANRNGVTAMTRIILADRAIPDSLSPGAITYRTSGSAKMIMRMLAISVASAMRLMRLVDRRQADSLLPVIIRWLNTGIKLTLSAPDTRMKNMKSG